MTHKRQHPDDSAHRTEQSPPMLGLYWWAATNLGVHSPDTVVCYGFRQHPSPARHLCDLLIRLARPVSVDKSCVLPNNSSSPEVGGHDLWNPQMLGHWAVLDITRALPQRLSHQEWRALPLEVWRSKKSHFPCDWHESAGPWRRSIIDSPLILPTRPTSVS